MLITRHGFRIFTQYDLEANLRQFLANLEKEIESDRDVLTADEGEYIRKKIEGARIGTLVLHADKITVSQKECDIPADYFPGNFSVDRGTSYPKPVLTFHLPFDGDEQWLKCRPSSFVMWSEEVAVSEGEIHFEIINFSNDADKVKKERDDFIRNLEQQAANVNQNLAAYNAKLEAAVKEGVKKAKNKFKVQDDFMSKLGNSRK